MRRAILLAVCVLLGTPSLWGQLSTQHYIPPVPDLVFDDAFLYVSTPHPNVTFTLKPVGGLQSSWVSQTIDNTTSAKIPLASSQVSVDPSFFTNNQVYNNIGYVLTADREVYVSLRLKSLNHAGALVSKGLDGLGKSFRVGGMERKTEPTAFDFGDWSFFSIMATKDATIVNFEDVDPLLVAENLNGSLPATITLDESETYLALFNGQNNERFIGTHVKSQNHDIIVNSGSIIGSFSDEIIDLAALPDGLFPGETTAHLNGSDMGFDQMVSLDGGVDAKEYLLIKGDSFDSIENALVIANEPNTAIYLNGSSTVYTTLLNAGDHVFIEGNEFVSSGGIGYLQISADKNIYVFQGTGKKGTGTNLGRTVHWYGANQGMFFVPPLSCASVGDVESIARIEEVDDTTSFFGSLFVISTDGSTVEVDGLDINVYPSVQTISGIAADGRSYQVHRVDNLFGDVSVVGSEELYVSYYNYNGNATSGAFYSGFALEPRIFPEITLNALGVCFDPVNGTNVTLNLPNSTNYDSWKWQKQDTATGAWNDILGGTSDPDTYIPAEYGIYRVKVNINCLAPNNIIFSDPLTVSVCPPDFDNDGVVNNIDLDNDNDGVLDAVESYGNFDIDLSVSPPQINAPGIPPSSVPDLQQTLTTTNGIFTPSTNGSFTSFLPVAGLTSSETLVYELKPVNPGAVHLKFGLNGAIPSENEVSYILESVDPSEGITLLNPSDELELLIGGVYVGGQALFNASKIEFRFNPALAGTNPTDFSFMVYNTSGLKFTHINESTANNSTFNGVFEVINLDRFSDRDFLSDIFDADSDGDGCSDVLEAGFTDDDDDDKVLVGPLTFDGGTVDAEGLVVGHNYAQIPSDNDSNGVYDFQEFNSISIAVPPIDISHCVGDSAVFEVTSDGSNYQWQVLDVSGVWLDLSDGGGYSGTSTPRLQIDNVTIGLDASQYRVAIWKDALVCQIFSSSAELEVTPLPAAPILTSSKYGFCIDVAPTVGDLVAAISTDVLIYDSATATSPLASTDLLTETTYHVSAIDMSGCESTDRTEVETVIEEILLASSNVLHQECDETDGVGDLKVLTNLRAFESVISSNHTRQKFDYYFDAAHTNPLPDPSNHVNVDPVDGITPLTTQTIYVKLESVFESDVFVVGSCDATAEIVLETSLSKIPGTFTESFYACESPDPAEIDGITSFNPSIFDALDASLLAIPVFAAQPGLSINYYGSEMAAQNKLSPIQRGVDYTNQNPTVDGINWKDEIWANVTVEASGSFTCFGFAKVADLFITRSPEFDLAAEAVICLNEGAQLLESENPIDTYDYLWSHVDFSGSPTPFSATTADITITEGGTYTLTATTLDPAACSVSKSINVLESEVALLTQDAVIVSDLTSSSENTVSVDVSQLGVGDYEYALDGGPFQNDPTFVGIRPGVHALTARDKNGCGITLIDISVIGYYKYFSPNNDGINDYWKILGVDGTFYNTSKIYIFDRFGRLLSQLQNDSPGWDGTFKGNPMPADDYWFRVELDDGRSFDGHFSLMR